MTIQQLINNLQDIEDKTKLCQIFDGEEWYNVTGTAEGPHSVTFIYEDTV